MDNLRRRTEREVKDAKSYAACPSLVMSAGRIRQPAPCAEAVPGETVDAADAVIKPLLEGVEMTERSRRWSTLGASRREENRCRRPEFDPNFHQAMFEVPNPNVPNNTVVQVVQAGYTIGERVLRPAMVGVAKGGPEGRSSGRGIGRAQGRMIRLHCHSMSNLKRDRVYVG